MQTAIELGVTRGGGSAAASPPDGNDEYTTVMLHLNGTDGATTFDDDNEGGSAHTWTAGGDAQLDTAEKKFGSAALLCDGTGDYITTPDHADWHFGSDDFTIDLWFNRSGGDGTTRGLMGQAASGVADVGFYINMTAGNVLSVTVQDTGGQRTVTGTTAFTVAGWNHVEVVKTGTAIKLFVNGVKEGTDGAMVVPHANSAAALSIGRIGAHNGFYWVGSIDEVRISKGIARHTENFTPMSTAYSP
jgi:hypothetical protein